MYLVSDKGDLQRMGDHLRG